MRLMPPGYRSRASSYTQEGMGELHFMMTVWRHGRVWIAPGAGTVVVENGEASGLKPNFVKGIKFRCNLVLYPANCDDAIANRWIPGHPVRGVEWAVQRAPTSYVRRVGSSSFLIPPQWLKSFVLAVELGVTRWLIKHPLTTERCVAAALRHRYCVLGRAHKETIKEKEHVEKVLDGIEHEMGEISNFADEHSLELCEC